VGARTLGELEAYKLAREFKLEVYRLIRNHAPARADFKYCDQLRGSASSVEANLAEGWRRYVARDMAQFVRIALASLEEARVWLRDGIDRGYFTDSECAAAFEKANRCGAATMALLRALLNLPPKK
jgi:four helix bundle protein